MLVLVCSVSATAQAHPETAPGLVNRYVTVAVPGDTALLSVALLFGTQPASNVRKQADVNGDGVLDPGEQKRLHDRYQTQAKAWLALTIDGNEIPFAPAVTVDLGPSSTVSGALVVEATMKLPLNPRVPHTFHLIPKNHPAPQGETEVTALTGSRWALVTPSRQGKSVKVVGPTPPGFNATFVVAPKTGATPVWPWLALLAAALAVAATFLTTRRRR